MNDKHVTIPISTSNICVILISAWGGGGRVPSPPPPPLVPPALHDLLCMYQMYIHITKQEKGHPTAYICYMQNLLIFKFALFANAIQNYCLVGHAVAD